MDYPYFIKSHTLIEQDWELSACMNYRVSKPAEFDSFYINNAGFWLKLCKLQIKNHNMYN